MRSRLLKLKAAATECDTSLAMACFALKFNSASAAKRLLEWKQGKEDDRWNEKAVILLVKKLTKPAIAVLELALSSASADTMCVTLDRTYDGKLQVHHRKDLPHVIYCRVWRWPDLVSYHELRGLPNCEFAFSRYKDKICINPYHYTRVYAQELPSVVVPPRVSYACAPNPHHPEPDNDAAACADDSLPRAYMHTIFYHQEPEDYAPVNIVSSLQNSAGPSSSSNPSPLSSGQSNSSNPSSLSSGSTLSHPSPLSSGQSNSSNPSSLSSGSTLSHPSPLSSGQSNSSNPSPLNSGQSNSSNPSSLSSGQSNSSNPSSLSSGSTLSHPSSLSGSSGCSSSTSSNGRSLECGQNSSSSSSGNSSTTSSGVSIQYSPPKYWCSIYYYELNERVGEAFYASGSTVTIDGYTDTNCANDRFCLGHLSNIHRNQTMEQTRKNIGNGVELVYTCGDVFVRCLSFSPVFIHSRISNQINGYMPTAVCKLLPGAELKVFDNQLFAAILSQTVEHCNNFKSVYDLITLCYIKLSFVKGWGERYHRQEIRDTPCWLEIQVHGAMTWIDKVLHQMKLQSSCGSDS